MSERNERAAWEVAWERDQREAMTSVVALVEGTSGWRGLEDATREGYRLGFEAGVRATGQAADNLGSALERLIRGKAGTSAEPRGEG